MDRPTEPAVPPEAGASPARPPTAPPEPVQRWRITFARDRVPPETVGRATIEAWQAALSSSGLAVAVTGSGDSGGPARARFSIGAPLAASAVGRAELAEVWLTERVPVWALREALADRLPRAHHWVGAEDVWLGAPPLPGQVTEAEWTVVVDRPDGDPAVIAAGAASVLAARSLPRVRAKAGGDRPFDLRPLLADVTVSGNDEGRVTLRVVTRLDPALGSGRPEDVVAAVAESAGLAATPAILAIVRERLILADPGRLAGTDRATHAARRGRR